MKLARLVLHVPIDPKDLKRLSKRRILERIRTIVNTYIPKEGLIVAVFDPEPTGEVYKPPMGCHPILKVVVKALILDIAPNDVYVGRVKKLSGRGIVISIGENILEGFCHVTHAGPGKYRYIIELDRVFRIDRSSGKREEYLKVGDVVRMKVTGGVGQYGVRRLNFSMRGERLGPIEEIKKKREEVMKGENQA